MWRGMLVLARRMAGNTRNACTAVFGFRQYVIAWVRANRFRKWSLWIFFVGGPPVESFIVRLWHLRIDDPLWLPLVLAAFALGLLHLWLFVFVGGALANFPLLPWLIVTIAAGWLSTYFGFIGFWSIIFVALWFRHTQRHASKIH
jgi:hypothetical protein